MGFVSDLFRQLTFAEPSYFVLWPTVVMIGLAVASALVAKRLLRPKASRHSRYRIFHKELPWLAAIIIAAGQIVILARPQLPAGFKIAKAPVDIIVAWDDSPSMTAKDVRPNRLEVAKSIIFSMISSDSVQTGDRMMLILFGRDARSRMPLSSDKKDFVTKVAEVVVPGIYYDDASTDTSIVTVLSFIPQVLDAQDKFEHNSSASRRIVILLSDGDDDAKVPVRMNLALQELHSRHIPVYCIGVGTVTGAQVKFKVAVDKQILEFEDRTQLRPEVLVPIAQVTGGRSMMTESDKPAVQSFLANAIESNRPVMPHLVPTGSKDSWWEFSVALLVLSFLALVL